MNIQSKNSLRLLQALVLLLMTSGAHAATYDLDLFADGDSRWFDLLSAAFGQIDKGAGGANDVDGFFKVDVETADPSSYRSQLFDFDTFDPVLFSPLGGGSDIFPNESIFQGPYSLTYNDTGLTGVGHETAPLIGASLDFDTDIADNDSLTSAGYESVVNSVAGTIGFINGQVAAINGVIDLQFDQDYSFYGAGIASFYGELVFTDRRWNLFADGSHTSGVADELRIIWDAHGYVGLYETMLPGDYNNDGRVDAADYTVWRDNLGGRQGTLPNDIDGGDISETQYQTWVSNYGNVLLSNSAQAIGTSVPEPSTAVLVVLILTSVVGTKRISRQEMR